MAIEKNTGSVFIGETHQHVPGSIEQLYAQITSSLTETSTSVSININAAMYYTGYDNYVPWEVGVMQVNEGEESFNHNGNVVQGHWERTAPMGDVNNPNWWWMGNPGSFTFTINKTNNRIGIMPYVKIGSINRWGAMGDSGSGDYWVYGNEYGILCMNSVNNDGYHSMMNYNGVGLDAFALYAGQNDTFTLNYANCPMIANPLGSVFVRNSEGAAKRCDSIYVYGSDGKPKRVTSIVVYNADGKAVTIPY